MTQRKDLCLISDCHLGIIAVVYDTYSRWTEPDETLGECNIGMSL